jgi:hypothetical protein
MPKLPLPFGKPKTIPMPKREPQSSEDRQIMMQSASAVAQILGKKPKAAAAAAAAAKPAPRKFQGGMNEEQYAGEKLKDYSQMRPKLATKDKILNPVKKAVGLPGKPAKMVAKKPGER